MIVFPSAFAVIGGRQRKVEKAAEMIASVRMNERTFLFFMLIFSFLFYVLYSNEKCIECCPYRKKSITESVKFILLFFVYTVKKIFASWGVPPKNERVFLHIKQKGYYLTSFFDKNRECKHCLWPKPAWTLCFSMPLRMVRTILSNQV